MLRKIPIVGRLVEIANDDPYKMRLKNYLRRVCVSASVAAALLSGFAAVVGAGALAYVGSVWEEIDRAIDNLTDDQAQKIYEGMSFTGAGQL